MEKFYNDEEFVFNYDSSLLAEQIVKHAVFSRIDISYEEKKKKAFDIVWSILNSLRKELYIAEYEKNKFEEQFSSETDYSDEERNNAMMDFSTSSLEPIIEDIENLQNLCYLVYSDDPEITRKHK